MSIEFLKATPMTNALVSELHPNRNVYKSGLRDLHKKVLVAMPRALTAIAGRVAKARQARRRFEELNAMSDHELEDIGITRVDIPAIVAGIYRDERSAAASPVIPFTRRSKVRSPKTADPPQRDFMPFWF